MLPTARLSRCQVRAACLVGALAVAAALVSACAAGATPTSQPPTVTPSPAAPSPTLAPTATLVPTPTSAPTSTPVPTSTAAPTSTPTSSATATPSATPTSTPTRAVPAHFESTKNGFGFDYPGEWRLAKSASEKAKAGAASIEDVGVGLPDGPRLVVSVYQLKQVVTDANLPAIKAELDTVVEQASKQVDGKILVNQPFKIGTVGGFEHRIEFARGGTTLESRQLSFFVTDRQYRVALEIDTAGQRRYAPDLERLVASFEAPSPGPNGERLARAEVAAGHKSDYEPERSGPYFPKGTQTVEVVFALEKGKAGQSLVGTWVADRVTGEDPGASILEGSITVEGGEIKGYFSMHSGEALAPGDYALELRIGGKLLRRVRVHIAD